MSTPEQHEQQGDGQHEDQAPAWRPTSMADVSRACDVIVEVLTGLGRLREQGQQGGVRRVDLADVLASALASVAANLGGVEELLAGRSGSWEADHLRSLIGGTVGHDGEYLLGHRTDPVVVPLNVADLAYMQHGDDRRDEEVYAVTDRYRDIEDAEDRELTDEEAMAEQRDVDAIEQRWKHAYAAYVEAFTAAVVERAAGIDGLSVPVVAQADATHYENPGPRVENPDEWDHGDPIAWTLWEHATRTLPKVGDSTQPGAQHGSQQGAQDGAGERGEQ